MKDRDSVTSSRFLKKNWPLAASFAINMFLIGIVAAPLFGHMFFPAPPFPRPGALPPELVIERLGEQLPPEDAQKVKAIVNEGKNGFRRLHDDMSKGTDRLLDIMAQEKPDQDEVEKVLKSMDATGEGFHRNMAQIVRRTIKEVPSESRRRLVRLFKKAHQPGGGALHFRKPPPFNATGHGPQDPMMPPSPPPGMPIDDAPLLPGGGP